MGLDITVFTNPKLIIEGTPKADQDYDGWFVRGNRDFPYHAVGLPEGVYQDHESWGFRAGSYSGYNYYRNVLARAGMGADDKTVWDNPVRYVNKPFYEQVNFSDCEGVIAGPMLKKLATDYKENRLKFIQEASQVGDTEWLIQKYDEWAQAFEDAAKSNGFIVFH